MPKIARGSRRSGGRVSRRRRRGSETGHTKGLEPLSNVPLPQDNEDSDPKEGEEDDLSEQDFEFVAANKDRLTFLEKIERDELDQQVLSRQKAEMEKRQEKIERMAAKRMRESVDEANVDLDDEQELDALDRVHAKWQAQKKTLPEKKTLHAEAETETRLPMKTPDGRVVFEQQDDAAAAELARRVAGVVVDDAFVEGEEIAPQDETDPDGTQLTDVDATQSEITNEADRMELDAVDTDADAQEMQDYRAMQMTREQLKTQIAMQANKMLTNAERSVAPMKKLLLLCKNSDAQIQRLAMVSCMCVFKDIVPGYRIASNTASREEQAKKKVDKEQLKTKEYESLLLRCYQTFLKILLHGAQSAREANAVSMLRVCVKCLCGLAESLHHFNYGTDLIKAVVSWMKSPDQVIIQSCCNSIAHIIQTDLEGDRILEAVQFIGDLIKKQKCKCDPAVVQCLLGIVFNDLPTLSKEEKKEKKTTKNRRKRLYKIRDALEKEGKEFDVHKPPRDKETEKKAQLQSKTAEALFEIFFRVLKHCSHQVHSRSTYEHEESVHAYISKKCPLLSVCLRGLAKHAHIMSVEYFEDLLKVMSTLLNCDALPFHERFQCLIAISSIFRGQGDALNIDRRDFYRQLYVALNNWKPDTIHSMETDLSPEDRDSSLVLVHVCNQMLCETKTSDFGRLAAFVKRMLSVSVHQETGITMGLLAIVNRLLVKYRRLRALVDGDSETPINGSLYDPAVDDPSQADGLLTTVWELALLQKHFNPDTAQAARHLLKINPDATETAAGYMAAVLSCLDGPPGIVHQYSTTKGTFCPKPVPAVASKTRSKRKRAMQTTASALDLVAASDVTETDLSELERCLTHHASKLMRVDAQIDLFQEKQSMTLTSQKFDSCI